MEKYFGILRKCSLFYNIEDKNLMPMLGCLGAKVAGYNKNETIMNEGDPAKYIGIVLSGSVQIVSIDYYGNRSIVTRTEPTELFGESFACAFHQQMIYNLMKVVATKNIIFHQKIEITSQRSTREKLMTYLLLQAKKNKSNQFEIPYDRQGLADYLGVERSGLSVEISKLRKERVIENRRNYFELL